MAENQNEMMMNQINNPNMWEELSDHQNMDDVFDNT
jgi:hypothetical protein